MLPFLSRVCIAFSFLQGNILLYITVIYYIISIGHIIAFIIPHNMILKLCTV